MKKSFFCAIVAALMLTVTGLGQFVSIEPAPIDRLIRKRALSRDNGAGEVACGARAR